MINPQLLNYVRAQRAAGVQREEIIKALAGGGWSAQDAQEAFAAIEGVQVPPVTPKPVPPPAPVTPVSTPAPQPRPVVQQPIQPVTSVQQPVQPTAMSTMSTRIQPQAVVQRQPVYAPAPKRRTGLWMFLLIFFLIIGFVGGAYAAVAVPAIEEAARDFKNMIMPPTLEPVMQEETTQNTNPLPFEPFAPAAPQLGGSTASSTTATSTASTTPR